MRLLFYIFIYLLFSLACFDVFGSSKNSCDCEKELMYVKSKISKNYAGFHDKVNSENLNEYNKFTKSYLRKSKKISDPFHCVALINRWLQFFNEGNIRLEFQSPDFSKYSDFEIKDYFSNTRTFMNWSEQDFIRYFSKKPLEPIEGIWENNRRTYKTAIIRNPKSKKDSYLGIVLDADGTYWVKGMIKLEILSQAEKLTADFYYKNHDPKILNVKLIDNSILEFKGLTQWYKTYPQTKEVHLKNFNPNYYRENNPLDDAVFESINTETNLLKMPSFAGNAGMYLDSLVKNYNVTLGSKANLIIDLRGNSEGSDYTFMPLLQAIYTHPIFTDGVKILASSDNIFSWEILLTNPNFSPEVKLWIRDLVTQMKQKENGYVEVPGETTTLKVVQEFPKKVAILFDETCAGSCEQFLLLSKQSDKVVLMGSRSAGVYDYSHMRSSPLLCLPYNLRYATSVSMRVPHNPINVTGVIPDVLLEEGNWIAIATDHLKKH